jgi:hypothetical protein
MLPHEGTKRLVSCCLLRRVFVNLGFYCDAGLLEDLRCWPSLSFFVFAAEVRAPCFGQGASPRGGDL